MGFLNQKLGIDTVEGLMKEISTKVIEYDFMSLANNVSAFVVHPEDIKRVERFKEFWDQVELD